MPHPPAHTSARTISAASFRLLLLGILTALPLLFASNVPSLFAVAPLSVACWALLALERESSRARPAMATLFLALWAFYAIGQHFFIAWGVAAWLLATLYQALLTVLPAIALRAWHARFPRLPLALTVAVTWVSGEFLRAQGPFGLPSGSLALPLAEKPLLMQTADLGGMYAVSLPLAATAGLLAEAARNRVLPLADRRSLLRSVVGVLLCWAITLGYGAFRLTQGNRTITPAVRVAVVQTDAPTDLRLPLLSPKQLSTEVLTATNAAVAETRDGNEPPPALFIWPESPGFPPLTPEFLNAAPTTAELANWGMTPQNLATYRSLLPYFEQSVRRMGGASLLYGCSPPEPDATAPGGWRQYNTAILWQPDGSPYAVRQNKVHLAPFGEYLPGVPYGAISPALRRLLPDVQNLSPGDRRPLFTLPGLSKPDGSPMQFAIVICNESALPTTAGVFNRDPATIHGADFIAVMANEGSFGRGELSRHSARVCAYRAIEARVGIARTANTGISGFYKPDGTFYGAVRNPGGEVWTGKGFPERALLSEVNRLRQQSHGQPDTATEQRLNELQARIAALRETAGVRGSSLQSVYIDTRAGTTLYAQWGDWLGYLLLATTAAGLFLPRKLRAN